MPGLFSRYGALGNPVVDALGLTSAGGNLATGNLAAQKAATEPDVLQQRFEAAGLLKGQPVFEIPRQAGPFGRLLENWGLMSPTIKARAKDYLSQQADIAGVQKSRLDAIDKVVKMRDEMTAPEWNAVMSSPAGQTIAQVLGGATPGLAEPSIKELTMARIKEQQDQQHELTKSRIKLEAYNAETSRMRAEWLLGKPKPGSPEDLAAKGAERKAEAIGALEGVAEATGRSWDAEMAKYPNRHYMRLDTTGPIKMSDYRSPNDAKNDPNVVIVNGETSLKDWNKAGAMTRNLDEMASLLPGMYVDENKYGGNKLALTSAIAANGHLVATAKQWMNPYNRMNGLLGVTAMGLGHITQGRALSGLALTKFEQSLPDITHDSLQTAQRKIESQKAVLRTSIGAQMKADNAAFMRGEATEVYNRIVAGPPEGEPDMGPEPSTTLPETVPSPSGLEASSRALTGEPSTETTTP